MNITLQRRHLLMLGACASIPGLAGASTWPEKPVRLVVPSAPSTPGDNVARAFSDLMQARLGQPLVVENRSGAQGLIGLEAVAKAAPDGYTFGLLNIQQAIIPAMRKLPFDLNASLQPVVQLTTEATVLVVGSAVPANTVSELIELVRKSPGKFSYGSSGNGSPSHVGMELLRRQAQLEMMHVPYRAPGAVINDMAGGQLQIALLNSNPVLQALPTGKIRALAVSSEKRLASLPQVPTLAEAGFPAMDLRGWVGVVGPAGIDAEIVRRVNAAFNEALQDRTAQERLRRGGSEPAGGTVRQFADHIASETRRWGRVVQDANIKMD